jgi:hypothetical protein
MARKLSIATACAPLAIAALLFSGCFGGGDDGAREDRERAKLAGIYGTWTSKEGFVVVLLADRSSAIGGTGQISGIPGEINGRIMIKDPTGSLGKKPNDPKVAAEGDGARDSLWKQGVYKVVGRRLLARSTTEEIWAVSFSCELNAGKLFMATGDGGKEVELFRSAKPEVVKTDVE